MLRVSERTDRIEHLPRILYHWRKLPGEHRQLDGRQGRHLGASGGRRQRATSSAGIPAFARPNPSFPHRAIVHPKPRGALAARDRDHPDEGRPPAPRPLPRVDLRAPDYPNLDVLLVDNGTTDPRRGLFERHPVEVLPFDGRSTSRARTTSGSRTRTASSSCS